jgi:hypothetical protein
VVSETIAKQHAIQCIIETSRESAWVKNLGRDHPLHDSQPDWPRVEERLRRTSSVIFTRSIWRRVPFPS